MGAPDSLAREVIEGWSHELRLPRADYGQSVVSVRPPNLIDAAGVDGRFLGSVRTFPGFAALGIADAYEGYSATSDAAGAGTPGVSLGPLLVGPGIDHTTNGTTVNWQHWKMRVSGWNSILYFKSLSFWSDPANSKFLSGFLIYMKYNGPTWDGVSSYNKGLPPASDYSAGDKYLFIFLYWDDEEYPHPTISGSSRPAGWRVRILTNPKHSGGGVSSNPPTEAFFIDGDAEGRRCYLVSGSSNQNKWGPPDAYTGSDADGGSGPQVMEWKSSYHYPRLRPMGPKIAESEEPNFRDNKGGAPCDAGSPYTSKYSSGGKNAGRIHVDYSDAKVRIGLTLKNSSTGARSKVFLDTTVNLSSSGFWAIAADVAIHTTLFNQFDQIELWRTPPDSTGVLYRENIISMGSAPAHSSTIDCSPDDGFRIFRVGWGIDDIATFQADTSIGGSHRDDWLKRGLDAYGVAMETPYNGAWDFHDSPPSDTSRIVVRDQISYITSGTTIADKRFWASGVEPRLRWSSLVIPNPENFGEITNLWHPDEAAGIVYSLAKVGDQIFVIGSDNTVSARPQGTRVHVSNVGNDVAPIQNRAWTAGGTSLFVLARGGLIQVDGASGQLSLIPAVNRIIYSEEEWGFELAVGGETQPSPAEVYLTYDQASSCLYIVNLRRAEALLYWPLTGNFTRLLDFQFAWATQGPWPGRASTAVRAWFCGPVGIEKSSYQDFEIFTPNFPPKQPPTYNDPNFIMVGTNTTMQGDPFLPSDSVDELAQKALQGTITNYQSLGSNLYSFDVALSSTPTSKAVLRLGRRFGGAFIHLFDSSFSTHIRGIVSSYSATSNALRITFYVDPKHGTVPDLTNGWFSVAPIRMRIILPLFPDEAGNTTLGSLKSMISGSLAMDFISIRRFADSSGNELGAFTTDASNMIIAMRGYSHDSRPLTDADSFKPQQNPYVLGPQAAWTWNGNLIGKLVEEAISKITPSRLQHQTSKKLAFNANKMTVGIELFCSGAQVELHGIRLIGMIKPSSRRTG